MDSERGRTMRLLFVMLCILLLISINACSSPSVAVTDVQTQQQMQNKTQIPNTQKNTDVGGVIMHDIGGGG